VTLLITRSMKKTYKFLKSPQLIALSVATLLSVQIKAQITLINPTGDGGFETGTTFAANSWSVAQSAVNRAWYVGTAQAGYSGAREAHIGNSATNLGANNSIRVVHLYRNVAIPAGASNIVLSFKYKQPVADNTYDYMQVFMNGNTPVNGTAQTSGLIATLDPVLDADYANFTAVTYTLSNSVAGATNKLIFTFNSDDVTPIGQSAIDDVSLTYIMPSCPAPSAISLTGIASTSANATWVPSGSEPSWDLYYGPSPLTSPASTTVPTATTSVTSHTLAGLSPATGYAFYVRAHCSGVDQSAWNGPYSFITPCQAPAILNTTAGIRCGIGTTTLGATVATGGNLSWYTAATGGTAIAAGPIFTTPVISTTTNYYVSSTGAPYISAGGLITPIPTSTTSLPPLFEGIVFDATKTFTLVSVDVYPDGAADDLYIDLYDNAYNLIGTYTGSMPAGNGATPFTVPLNFVVPPGTDYHFEVLTDIGTALTANTGASYPYPIGSVGSVTSGFDGSNPGAPDYFYLYNLKVSSICESPRTMVTASVTPPPALTVTSGTTVCANAISTLSVTSTVSDFNNYTWTPNTNLYTNAGATTPYTNTSANTLYYKSVTNGPTTYTLTATNSSNCVNVATVTMIADVPVILASSTPSAACLGSTVAIAANNLLSGNVTVGAGTGSTGADGITPYSSNYEGSREQYLFRASELLALNLRAGNISSLSFSVTVQGTGAFSQNNFTIKMAHTTNTVLASSYGTPSGAVTSVYGPTTQGLPVLGTNTYNFSSPFNWDGVSNILVDVCHDNDVNGTCVDCYSDNSEVAFTNPGFNCIWGSFEDDVQNCGVQTSNTVGNFVRRPNMTFNGQVVNTGSNITWLINPGAINTNTASVTPSTTGAQTYTVMATNNLTGCSNNATTSFTINASPSVTVAASTGSLCAGTSATLTASGAATYSWMPAGGASSVAVVSPAANTVYTVTGTNPGCSDTKTISLNVSPSPTVTASISPGVICAGATVSLTASGATTYSWMPNGSTSGTTTATPAASTIYTVSGTTAGCSNTKTLSVTVNNVPSLTLTTNPASGVLCSTGATATLTAAGTSTAYVWSSGSKTATTTVSPAAKTVYIVTGTNSCGVKTVTTSITVATTPTIAAMTSATVTCSGNPAVLTTNATPGVIFAWNTGASTASITVTPTTTITYTVTGTNACGTATATVVQNVIPCTGIEETANGSGISLYPNPANDYVSIAVPASLASANTSIEVTDALGKVVIRENNNTDVTTLRIAELKDGIYFFKVISNNQTVKVGKLVKH
jgi:hypothetical protein